MTSEMLAMLDVHLSDGRRYPTLDEYQRALDEIHATEERARSAFNSEQTRYIRASAAMQQGQLATRALDIAAHAFNPQSSPLPDANSALTAYGVPPLATRELWFRIELESDGQWYPVQGTDSQLDEYLREYELPRHQRAQPHVHYRIVDYRK